MGDCSSTDLSTRKETHVSQRTIQEQLTGLKPLISAGETEVRVPVTATGSVTRQRQQMPTTPTSSLPPRRPLDLTANQNAELRVQLQNEIQTSASLSRELQQEKLAHQATRQDCLQASNLTDESLDSRVEAVTSREDYVLAEEGRLSLWADELERARILHNDRLLLITQMEQCGKDATEILHDLKQCEAGNSKLKRAKTLIKKMTLEMSNIESQRDDINEKLTAKKSTLSKERKENSRLVTERDEYANKLETVEHALQNAIEKLHSEVQIRSEDTLAWMVQNYSANGQDVLPKNILLVGDDPWPTGVLSAHLQQFGFEVWQDGYSEECEVMVVGREHWSEADIEAQVNARENRPLRIYPQELFVLCLAMGADPFDIADKDALMLFAEGHPVFDYLLGQQFPWPDFEFEVGPPHGISGTNRGDDDESSPLYLLGYNVAQNNRLPMGLRHELLEKALSAELLPWTISDTYMERWGKAGTSKRLRRIAWHLYLMSKRHGHHPAAVAKWESDLKWLRQTHYKPIQRFTWPN